MPGGGVSPGEAADVLHRNPLGKTVKRVGIVSPAQLRCSLGRKDETMNLSTRWGHGARGDRDLL